MLTRFISILFLLFALAIPCLGQLPSCDVSGTAYGLNGQPAAGVRISVVRVEQAGTLIAGPALQTTSASDGIWTITVPRSSNASFCYTGSGFVSGMSANCSFPTRKTVPNAATANYGDLSPVINPTGTSVAITLKDEGVALANPSSTLNFVGSGVSAVQTSPGVATVTINTGVSNHNLLSSAHPDTTAASVVRGDLITGQGASPTWSRLALGASGTYARSDGADLAYSPIQAGDLPSGIDTAKLADGSVSNAEFQRLDGVTSGIQSQLDGKAATSHVHAGADITSGTIDDARLSSNVTLLGNMTAGTGAVVRATSPTLVTPALGAATGSTLILTSNGGTIFAAGRQGSTDPAFEVFSNGATDAATLRVTAAAAGSGVTLAARGSGANESMFFIPQAQGVFKFGTTANPITTQGAPPFEVIFGGSNQPQIFVTEYGVGFPGVVVRKARGTATSPTAALSGDYLNFFAGRAYNGSAFQTSSPAFIGLRAAENVSTGASGTFIEFYTTPLGSTSSAERLRVDPSGNLGLGTASFGTSAAKVFYLTNTATAPTTQPADVIGIWGRDISAGKATLSILGESGSRITIGDDSISMATGTTDDTQLRRSAAGLFEINNFTAIGTTVGNARDLRLRAGYFAEASADPSAASLTIAGSNTKDAFAIYMKNDKFVIAYNNAGTVTYISIPLDGSATTWTHGTTAP